ncbi:uncharacterized protein [Rutidosis leptorrhynchoides]|uniref:uncharacterized protein n=1 Tax=Rutidosis leptorrhynchoides TaxID=125765 RepID=UPI003A98E497
MALKGSAREWFHSLQARSIIGFVDLREKFLLQFQNLLPQKKTHIECHDIKQGNKETLSALLTRYVYECQKIPSLNEDKKISGFLHAINPQRHPTLDSTITPACGWGRDKSWRDDNDSFRDGNMDSYRGSGFLRRNNGGSYSRNERFQMLTKTPKEILLQERVAKSFPDSQPLGKNSRRDRSKCCVFHDDYGHDTNCCRDLAELIAEAYEQGKLDHLIAQNAASTENAIIMPTEANTSNAPNVVERKAPAVKNLSVNMVSKKENQREIQVINLVEVQGEMSVIQISEQIVSWKCPSITFPPASLTTDVDKPVVVSCRIANTGIMIMKVHVDTGSSVDVMYEQCFSKLPAEIQVLMKPTAISLAGFSGESTWPVGQLELQMELVDDRD